MSTTSRIGGVETWLTRACNYFAVAGYDPVVCLVKGLKFNDPGRYKSYHQNLQTVVADGGGLDKYGRVRVLSSTIKSVRPDFLLPLGIVDGFEASVRTKHAGTKHYLVARTQGNLSPMFADLGLYKDWIDQAVCNGHMAEEVLKRWAGISQERIKYIPNGADIPVVAHQSRTEGAPLRIGYIGRMTQGDKRVLDLIPLVQELDLLGLNYSFDIVGDGPAKPEIDRAFQHHPRVKIYGALPHKAVYEHIFPNLDVAVITSQSESFGIIFPEAMLHGVVPVTSQYAGFYTEKLVEHGVTGLSFPVGDMKVAAKQIQMLLNDDSYRCRLASAAKLSAARFNWDICFNSWIKMFERLSEKIPISQAKLPGYMSKPTASAMTRLHLPEQIIHQIRLLRRRVLGPAIKSGGEEWPLYNRFHQQDELESIGRLISSIDSEYSHKSQISN